MARGEWITALALALAMTGCGAVYEPEAEREVSYAYLPCGEYPGPAAVTVGQGTQIFGFEPVEDGSELFYGRAPSGPCMLQLAILTEAVFPGEPGRLGHPHDPMVRTQVWHDDEVVAESQPLHMGLSEYSVDHNSYERSGILTVFKTERADELVGETLTLHASVEGACGNYATGEVNVLLVGAY